jgi:hypothetical protein
MSAGKTPVTAACDDIFEIQARVSRSIVAALRVQLSR